MKKVLLFIFSFSFCMAIVYAINYNFKIDLNDISLNNSKEKSIGNEFNQTYNISSTNLSSNKELKEKIENLSKKVTYLLLGNDPEEDSKEYYERHKDYLDLRYNPTVPKDNSSSSGLDKNSQEYKDDLVSGLSIPGMFNMLDELNIRYKSISSINISINDDVIISRVYLPNITMKSEDSNIPMNYEDINTNMILYYFFKELEGEYKLYYLYAETTDELNEYFNKIEDTENTNALAVTKNNNTNLDDIYDFSKLEQLNNDIINNVYEKNKNNVLMINSYYNNSVVSTAMGILIDKGLVVTTWTFLENSLSKGQYIVLRDNNDKIYNLDGIVTVNKDLDLAVLKLDEKIPTNIILGNSNNLKTEDPIISINSKSGLKLSVQTGIVISNDDYIESSIPLLNKDEGSPIFNTSGEIVGLNTSKSLNSSISIAIKSDVLQELKNKFENLNFEDIDSISFNKLKEKYFYTNYENEKTINSIPKNIWKKYKKIGNIEDNIKLELIKANYDKNIISLRYKNSISDYINSMQLSLSYRDELIKEGFKEILKSNSKCIYQNESYKVVIMDQFDYLIIVMVKL